MNVKRKEFNHKAHKGTLRKKLHIYLHLLGEEITCHLRARPVVRDRRLSAWDEKNSAQEIHLHLRKNDMRQGIRPVAYRFLDT